MSSISARIPELDYEPFYQYHNRLASFLSWPLNWDMDGVKPTPELLARAGFFYHAVEPYTADNVICPLCHIYLDEWEPTDNPMFEHKRRSPFCSFVRGRPPVRKINDDGTLRMNEGTPRDDKNLSNDKRPQDAQKPHSGNSRESTSNKKRSVAVTKSKKLARKATTKLDHNMKKHEKQNGE
ncbi:Baculoviral IAP repeat-containing protein 5.1 [Cytospora mali]|uniref:Baculoviral IAP repeat-containing protein 5.1 n=1 Tax=Cytospora mali TaxID=578113 RepID=A0A194V696_CYTMA|nr:Baculoviral IAP repeat-containing protein 5.1 [Valsa mali var. pyri (nom. inval.)]